MRVIRELIWHTTATPEGRAVSVADITAWHRQRGWKTIGYHKVIHLDGSVSEGRPETEIGAHVAGRNTGTIGYVYVGGVDAEMRAKDTRTDAQKATMERLTREAIKRYDLTMVSGHHDYAAKACPCFPARQEYAHLLKGGTSLPSPAPSNDAPASGTGTTTASSLILRRTPDGERIGSMPKGTPVLIYGSDGDWLNIETPFGARGWASRQHIVADAVADAAEADTAKPKLGIENHLQTLEASAEVLTARASSMAETIAIIRELSEA